MSRYKKAINVLDFERAVHVINFNIISFFSEHLTRIMLRLLVWLIQNWVFRNNDCNVIILIK